MKKIIRITTISDSLFFLLKGQLSFLNQYFDVVGLAFGIEGLKKVEEREGIRTIEVKMVRQISLWRDLLSLVSLIKVFIQERPFIVHANSPKGSLLAMLAAKITFVPHRIYTVTGLRFETATGFFRELLVLMEKITCWSATKVIPEGNGVKNTLIREKITSKELRVILNGNVNGIDLDFFCRKPEYEKKNTEKSQVFVFCYVGRLVRDKGINELIHAFVRLNNAYSDTVLLLIGSFEKKLDPLLPDVETTIMTHKSIKNFGFQSDIRPYLMISDTLVFPSYREGFPNVVLQAGAMGLPSIVTDINGCNEIIEDGINGKIIPPGNEKALYDEMEWFYKHRKNEVATMAKNARPMIENRYEQHKVWDALLKEYQSL